MADGLVSMQSVCQSDGITREIVLTEWGRDHFRVMQTRQLPALAAQADPAKKCKNDARILNICEVNTAYIEK